ncbi:hypothetical protein [Rhizobium sp. SYY.PMSO]|uniref:hypothetical protein n=1 Tax=Rhizobium sp. SYY.PMSO TaxID=3382192 RepID=UPI00398FF782
MTGADHEHNESVTLAAQWLADQREAPARAVPELRQRFGLSAVEACEAIATANRFRIYRRAHG